MLCDRWLKGYPNLAICVPRARTFKLFATEYYRHADTLRPIPFDSPRQAEFNALCPDAVQPLHQEKNLFLRTDRARFRTNSVRSLCPVLPDLPCLLCLSFLASGARGRPTLPPQRPTCLLRPHPLLVPPPCICPLILSSTASCLLLAVARVRPPSLLPSHLWRPSPVRFHPRPSTAILRHLFLSLHPTVTSIIPLLLTRRPARPPYRPPTLVGFPSHRRA